MRLSGSVAPVGPVPVGPVLAPGVVPAEVAGSVERDVPNIVRAFKSHLADYDLPDHDQLEPIMFSVRYR